MDAWSTVLGQRTMESICSMARDMEKLPTLRDQFAMAVINGIASKESNICIPEATDWAYQVADAMLQSRKEKK